MRAKSLRLWLDAVAMYLLYGKLIQNQKYFCPPSLFPVLHHGHWLSELIAYMILWAVLNIFFVKQQGSDLMRWKCQFQAQNGGGARILSPISYSVMEESAQGLNGSPKVKITNPISWIAETLQNLVPLLLVSKTQANGQLIATNSQMCKLQAIANISYVIVPTHIIAGGCWGSTWAVSVLGPVWLRWLHSAGRSFLLWKWPSLHFETAICTGQRNGAIATKQSLRH